MNYANPGMLYFHSIQNYSLPVVSKIVEFYEGNTKQVITNPMIMLNHNSTNITNITNSEYPHGNGAYGQNLYGD